MPRIKFTVAAVFLLLGGPATADQDFQTRDIQHESAASPIRSPGPAHRLPVQVVRRADQNLPHSTASALPSRSVRPGAIPIAPPTEQTSGSRSGAPSKATSGNIATVVLSSLAIVLGLFFLVVWLSRRALPRSSTSLPKDVLEIMGRSPLANRHNLQLIRLGRRLLLVSVTPDNAETLTEITDPEEVDHLAGLCRQHEPGSISDTFRQVLHQLGSQTSADDNAPRTDLRTDLRTDRGTVNQPGTRAMRGR